MVVWKWYFNTSAFIIVKHNKSMSTNFANSTFFKTILTLVFLPKKKKKKWKPFCPLLKALQDTSSISKQTKYTYPLLFWNNDRYGSNYLN